MTISYNPNPQISIPDSTVVSKTFDGIELRVVTGPDVYQPLDQTSPAFTLLHDHLKTLESTEGLKIADFGSGTGQFSVWTKNVFPDTEVHAYDIDPNTEKYQDANKELSNVDFTSHIMNVRDIPSTEEFDAIISSPPFIPDVVKKIGIADYLNDFPEVSIFGGYKGLEVIDIFIQKAGETLKSGGCLVQVHSPSQTEDVEELLVNNGFSGIDTWAPNVPTQLKLDEAMFTIAFKN